MVIGVGGVGGVGAFVGAVYTSKLPDHFGIRRTLMIILVAGLLAVLLIPASMINHEYGVWFLVASQFFEDALITIFLILALSLRQELIPTEMLGRANATFHVMTRSLFPVGALIAGPLTVWIGFETTLWIAALGGLLAIPVMALPRVQVDT